MKTEEQLKTLWALAFGDSREEIELFFQTAYAPQRCKRIVLDGQTAAALHWMDCEYRGQRLAYLYAVATHPDFRNRGLCRKLMEQTHTHLALQGYAGALLMPAERELRQMYGKMGYQDCCEISEFSCTAGEAIALRPVQKKEYARLRRQFLPADGVIQEGEALVYLSAFARFYAGKGFLLAAAVEKDRFFGIELLGSRAAAPGILAALGYEKGTFRSPGGDCPFAMFRPLRENAQAPSYLGLAFD